MVIAALLLLPLAAGLLAFAWRRPEWRRRLLLGTAVAHACLALAAWRWPRPPSPGRWLALDPPGLVFLAIVSALFMASAVYAVGYLRREDRKPHVDFEEGFLFGNEPEAVFVGCLLLFLAAMTLVTVCQHLGLLWVGVEATTLASAPLIAFHRHHRSLEATWKYLLICSVGIALALLGSFLLAVAAEDGQRHTDLVVADLLGRAGALRPQWLKAAFLFFLVGYGTKTGLAPMHTWLPDAHSEAPSLVSALLSGALLNCAFLGILRAHQLCVAAGEGAFSGGLLVLFGLLSMAVASIFLIRQADFKRMLAFSSVEHMGIVALGVGLGGAGAFGAMLHAVNHSLTKGALFLVAGTILTAYRTRAIREVSGALRVLPRTGVLWVGLFLAITGTPPFGTFLSEFTILKAAFEQGRHLVGALYLLFLCLVFVGMANIVLAMAQGEGPSGAAAVTHREAWWETAPPAVLAILVLLLGLHLPAWLGSTLERGIGVAPPPPRIAQAVSARGGER